MLLIKGHKSANCFESMLNLHWIYQWYQRWIIKFTLGCMGCPAAAILVPLEIVYIIIIDSPSWPNFSYYWTICFQNVIGVIYVSLHTPKHVSSWMVTSHTRSFTLSLCIVVTVWQQLFLSNLLMAFNHLKALVGLLNGSLNSYNIRTIICTGSYVLYISLYFNQCITDFFLCTVFKIYAHPIGWI